MEIKLYNSLSRKLEVFKPIHPGKVGIYTCGPTVYWYQHIGNLKAYLFSDTLRRVLEYNGLDVKQIINITDVGHLTSDNDDSGEDKMEKAALKEGKSAQEIANFYFEIFENDLNSLNILRPTRWTKATDHIQEQIALIQTLEKKGYTYQTSDGVYFDTSKVNDYGKLVNLKADNLKAGKRVAVGDKRNKTDFALWKFSDIPGRRQQEWASPWGIGFPGWHIECSAMSMKYLGDSFDIHTGGEDHAPVHHTNEIAQSEAATGKKFVNYWMHESFLLFKGEKVSKSKGGLYTLTELIKEGFAPVHFRFFVLLTHYRKPLNFSLDNLLAAKVAFERLNRKIEEISQTSHSGQTDTSKYESLFLDAINNDLNLPKSIQVLYSLVDDLHISSDSRLNLISKFDKVLGLGLTLKKESKPEISSELSDLLSARELARQEKNWPLADIMRQRIKEKGFEIEDTPTGARLKKI